MPQYRSVAELLAGPLARYRPPVSELPSPPNPAPETHEARERIERVSGLPDRRGGGSTTAPGSIAAGKTLFSQERDTARVLVLSPSFSRAPLLANRNRVFLYIFFNYDKNKRKEKKLIHIYFNRRDFIGNEHAHSRSVSRCRGFQRGFLERNNDTYRRDDWTRQK